MKNRRLHALLLGLAACHSGTTQSDADTPTRYDGTLTVTPDGASAQMMAYSILLGATMMDAGGCDFTLTSNSNGSMAFGCPQGSYNECTCNAGVTTHSTGATATLAGTMLTAHWTELGTDDARVVYDFTGTQAN